MYCIAVNEVFHDTATECHLPYGITQCYLLPDTSEHVISLNPSHAGRYSIYLPRRDGRLSWPSWLDSAPAGSQTSDLSITVPTPNSCTTKTTWETRKYFFSHRAVERWNALCQHMVDAPLIIPISMPGRKQKSCCFIPKLWCPYHFGLIYNTGTI